MIDRSWRRFYVPSPVEGYEWVLPDDEDYTDIHQLNGDPRASRWSPVAVRIFRQYEDEPVLRRAVTPWLDSSVVVLRDEAVAQLGPVVQRHGELLPLSSPDANLVIFTATRRLAALNEDQSEIVRFDSGGIMAVPNVVLRIDEIPDNVHAFMLAELGSGGPLLLSEELVGQIQRTMAVDVIEFEEATSI